MSKYIVSIADLKNIKSREDIPNLLKKMEAESICEIGVRFGEHLSLLINPNLKYIAAVDIWKETGVRSQNDVCYSQEELDRQYQTIIDMSNKNNALHVIRDYSLDASKKFDDDFFDFIYIDADHTESAVYADICAWWKKVRSGGVISGHDYSYACPISKDNIIIKFGVIEAVNRFVKQNNLILHVDENQSWFILKP